MVAEGPDRTLHHHIMISSGNGTENGIMFALESNYCGPTL